MSFCYGARHIEMLRPLPGKEKPYIAGLRFVRQEYVMSGAACILSQPHRIVPKHIFEVLQAIKELFRAAGYQRRAKGGIGIELS
jgi:hypothetical protein